MIDAGPFLAHNPIVPDGAFALTADGGGLLLHYLATVSPVMTGDLNGNGRVDTFALALILDAWAMSVPPGDLRADPLGNGVVAAFDLALALDNWGSVAPERAAVLPESAGFVWLALAGMLRRRRRRAG